ncbi:nucleoside triphosphate pyrophosphohydrolase [Marinospirillum alkaliphilum]|uniref:Nucleoside triphosphate pyrophosphohydrolase n=1 Tax=Marinospirillum alkaliphilum DSM 21637 TaxID=1122209 RepID=A0A1K1TE45_9GAMM|nr:nucleoside triphosphate pyrophosphohydrolase [Marinospirillum alkaliphilum]SFW98921.1 ATP diphosphatase [Marinospirillum alkaliphilum DSM 21637]
MSARYHLEDLLLLMARLRDPQQGCPWDLKQTWQSIVPHTLEEAYEVAECIEQGDYDHLKEELGDLLFQVVYYARFAEEEGRYDFADIVDGLTAKLVRRHPHVFPDGTLQSSSAGDASQIDTAAVKSRWEAIKAEERQQKQQAESVLDGVPQALPAITRALKLQKRAATVGFDWGDPLAVLDKLEEELAEIREALAGGDAQQVLDETGDFIFAAVNLARHLKIDPEAAVRSTNRKFEQRFRVVEALCAEQGQALTVARQEDPATRIDLQQLEAFWQEAKRRERQEQADETFP